MSGHFNNLDLFWVAVFSLYIGFVIGRFFAMRAIDIRVRRMEIMFKRIHDEQVRRADIGQKFGC